MGCYLALSLASRYPDRVKAVICSNLYYFPQEERENARLKEKDRSINNEDSWSIEEDGSHISKVWNKRSGWLSPELNTRATMDDLQYLVKRKERYAKGIRIQDGPAFDLETTCKAVTCPVLCVNGAGAVAFFDSIGMDMTGQFIAALRLFPAPPQTVELEAPSSINMLNENADGWLRAVNQFLEA